jgi:hypothetical protein
MNDCILINLTVASSARVLSVRSRIWRLSIKNGARLGRRYQIDQSL